MKHSRQDAELVVSKFQCWITPTVKITNYYTQDFFHFFDIEVIELYGTLRNKIRLKDPTLSQYLFTPDSPPDINEIINACFIYVD